MTSRVFSQQRADRYRHALLRFPAARTTELLALLPLCSPRLAAGTAVDLGAGSGYLSTVLEHMYKQVIRVDSSTAMLDHPGGQGSRSNFHLVGEMTEAAGMLEPGISPDLVVSLGTLHHVYNRQEEVVDPGSSRSLQEACVRAWSDRLAVGGCFVVADIGRPRNLHDDYLTRVQHDFGKSAGLDWIVAETLNESLPQYEFATTARSLGVQYESLTISSLVEAYIGLDWKISQDGPVPFFEDVVSKRSVDGHYAAFVHESDMRSLLEGAGLKNVMTGVIPTPWLFSDERSAAWFMNEFFALTPANDHAASRQSLLNEISAEVKDSLPIQPLSERTAVPWQLVIACGVKA